MTLPPVTHLLASLDNPNLALPLLLLGILLVYAECNLPGTVLPGSLGALLAMLALFGLSHLALNPNAIAIAAASLASLIASLQFLRTPTPKRPFSQPITGLVLPAAATLAITYALATLTRTPPIHPLVAIATGITFSTVTLWLGRIALLAHDNKRIVHPSARPRTLSVTTSANVSPPSTGVDWQ